MFEAHDLQVVIGSEHHAGMLGGLGGAFVSLDIIVAGADAEEAVALLRDMREGDHEALDDVIDEPEPDPGDPDRDAEADADGVWARHRERREVDLPAAERVALVIGRRRGTAIALLLAAFVGFGTAHMFTRAWLRGMVLAGVQLLGMTYIGTSTGVFVALSCGARLGDMVGAVWRIWSMSSATPPPAR